MPSPQPSSVDETPQPGDLQSWDRQSGESAKAYEAFRLYRDVDPGDRSQRKVASTLGKSGALISRWSSAHHWVTRAEAWDAHQEKLWQADLRAKRRRTIDRQLRIAQAAGTKVAQRLIDLDPAKLTIAEVTRLMEVAARIEREALALGQPHRVEVTGADGDPLSVAVAEFASMGAEQRRAAAVAAAADVQRRAAAAAGVLDDD